MKTPTKQLRGFAALSAERQREIASKGGKASHAAGTGHEWSKADAAVAGRLGGKASRGGRGKLHVPPAGASAAPADAPSDPEVAPKP